MLNFFKSCLQLDHAYLIFLYSMVSIRNILNSNDNNSGTHRYIRKSILHIDSQTTITYVIKPLDSKLALIFVKYNVLLSLVKRPLLYSVTIWIYTHIAIRFT